MPDKIISTRAVNENENMLRAKFYESIAAQSDLIGSRIKWGRGEIASAEVKRGMQNQNPRSSFLFRIA